MDLMNDGSQQQQRRSDSRQTNASESQSEPSAGHPEPQSNLQREGNVTGAKSGTDEAPFGIYGYDVAAGMLGLSTIDFMFIYIFRCETCQFHANWFL